MPAREVPSRFAVAFSLAGDERHLVSAAAQEVEYILGRSTVFYDDWYVHWIAGQDADILLQNVYGTSAELVVVCVSGAYGSKAWTTVEHRAIRARLMASTGPADRLRVLPLRVGDGEVPGVLFNEIAPDIRQLTPVETAEIIIARLNLVRGHAGSQPPAVPRWPAEAPDLHWPMADHSEGRKAFGRLLREDSPERVLLVRGVSETGKSHMSKQMIRNVMQLPDVVAGRFDFKGTTSLGVEAFAQPLGVEAPPGQNLNERFSAILAELRRRPRPTLLVFDTYEAAAEEVKYWIENLLLPYLVPARWLRVVITGQSVPARNGATWESVAANPLTLRAPGPEDWLAYGRANRGDIVTLEFVTQAHQLGQGKSSLLASLLGPET